MYAVIQIKCLKKPHEVDGKCTHDLRLLTPMSLPVAAVAVPKITENDDGMYGFKLTLFLDLVTMMHRDFPGWSFCKIRWTAVSIEDAEKEKDNDFGYIWMYKEDGGKEEKIGTEKDEDEYLVV